MKQHNFKVGDVVIWETIDQAAHRIIRLGDGGGACVRDANSKGLATGLIYARQLAQECRLETWEECARRVGANELPTWVKLESEASIRFYAPDDRPNFTIGQGFLGAPDCWVAWFPRPDAEKSLTEADMRAECYRARKLWEARKVAVPVPRWTEEHATELARELLPADWEKQVAESHMIIFVPPDWPEIPHATGYVRVKFCGVLMSESDIRTDVTDKLAAYADRQAAKKQAAQKAPASSNSWTFKASAKNPPNLARILKEASEEGLQAIVVRCGEAAAVFARWELTKKDWRPFAFDFVAVDDAGIIESNRIDRAVRPCHNAESGWVICYGNVEDIVPALRAALKEPEARDVSVEGVVAEALGCTVEK